MPDRKPELNKEEVRQGDRHHTNYRVLIISVVVLVIAFVAAYIYNQAVTPETETTLESGESIEDVAPEAVEPELETTPEGAPEAADPAAGELEVSP